MGSLLGGANLVTVRLLIATLCLTFKHKEACIPYVILQRNARYPRKKKALFYFAMVFPNPLKNSDIQTLKFSNS